MWNKYQLKNVYSLIVVLLIGTIFYHFAEGFRWIDALYFSVIALTTVGFGDFTPSIDLGKVFTIFYIFFGFGIMLNFINTAFEKRKQKSVNKSDEYDTFENE